MTKYVVSAGYDNNQNAVFLKLYDDKTQKLEEWFDDSYKAYCLSDKIESFQGMGVTNITTVNQLAGVDSRFQLADWARTAYNGLRQNLTW